MKSPVKDTTKNFKCTGLLKKIIPAGSVVNSFLFYDGQLELDLASDRRFICAHTNRYVVYEFWKCLLENPQRVHDIVMNNGLKFDDENMFYLLQKSWPQYKDPYLRAALFFILNRCSTHGLISSGKLDMQNFHPLALSYLRNFKIDNFHLNLQTDTDTLDSIESSTPGDFLLLPIGQFNYNLFEGGKSRGLETTVVHHQKIANQLHQMADQKWIIIYKNHPEIHKLYKGHNIQCLNKHGLQAINDEDSTEVIIANF
jgi:hypothetical protein